MSDNPLSQVYTAMWTLLTNNATWAAAVPSGNRLKYIDGEGNPLKDAAQYADFPSTMIEPVAGYSIANFDSTHCEIKKRFKIKVATGNLQTEGMLQLEWLVFVAMSNWQSTMQALSWKSKTGYVKDFGIYEHEETLSEREITQAETGWSTIWTGEVWLIIPTADVVVGPG